MKIGSKQALDNLKSPSKFERLQASRALEKSATRSEKAKLIQALHSETDAYVRASLTRALENISRESEVPAATAGELRVSEADQETYAKAIEEVTQTLAHEIEPLLGVLQLHAAKEVPNYSDSKTRGAMDRLDALFQAIHEMRNAAATPNYEEVSLPDFIDEMVADAQDRQDFNITRSGPTPFIVLTDRGLFGLIFQNGLRNAIEATKEVSPEMTTPIEVMWGELDSDIWVAVVDHGIGFTASQQSAFRIGTTTKSLHSGMGLPIAELAARSLNGRIELKSRTPNGAEYRATLPRESI